MNTPARLAFLVAGLMAANLFAADDYALTEDSIPQPGVPKGEVKGPFQWTSRIYPGTERDYWIYVPAQYDSGRKACVLVVQDGLRRAQDWNLIETLNNLIHKNQVPVTIGIFINPGVVPAPNPDAEARYNRSFEYDALGDRYARFLIDEILPEVGRSWNLSENPNDRMIAGASSGAICAFNVAWERPDAFRRVFSTIGTYVGLRGGDEFPTLVRKTEPKPIRVFLQDGSNDLNLYGGSWWTANQSMLAALDWAGYDVNHAWGDGGHTGRHGAAILPDALRWLWRNYPEPIQPGKTRGQTRFTVTIPGEEWQLVSEGHGFTEGPAVSENGEVFFTDVRNSRIFRIGLDGKVTLFAGDTDRVGGLMFGGDGRLYGTANGARQIVAYQPDGTREVVARDVTSNDLVVSDRGIFFTDPVNHQVCRIGDDNQVTVADQGIEYPNGIVLSPDRSLLYVADYRGRFVYSYQVQSDGSLQYKQEFFHLHIPHGQTGSGADGMAVDTEGRLYVATRMGVQVCDQPGRVNIILTMPPQSAHPSNVVFGGPDLDILFATCRDKVYRRKLGAQGFRYWRDTIKPPRPRL